MGIFSERSIVSIITLDNFKFNIESDNREEAFELLLSQIKDIQYKQASIFDYNTGSEVLSLRTLK